MKHCHDILLADANEAFCGLLQESIALRENYRVVRTKKGWDILRSVRERQPALLIMDPDLPDVNGAEVMRELGRQKLALRTIIISARVSNRLREEFFALGAACYLPKPFSHKFLLRRMDHILGRS
ncbi:MAG: response regulator [Oscillibacter sp.]|uniref:response regulator transcription factor n=1 Tax=Oscillibacter sp. MSJ-31 TaxID=2841526 RepID=UPI001C10C122|nr:response regulator [Oscillibacter sp. MSJ-31]MBU5458000.1 response regulator [Oscillibacter sp. MSJ-31]MDD7000821.1 response regulator [Oscillibacter sp.]